jgi:nucleoside-diphosphate-sugar epimerase
VVLYGGNGFIGSYLQSNFNCVAKSRNDITVDLENGDEIVYLISTTDNYNVKTNPYLDIDTNLTTLIKVLENFKNCPAQDKVFNFASSWFVYGDTELPAKEDSYCNPKGFYSITKRAAEQLLTSYCETFNLNYRILRFANVIGNGDGGVSKKKNALQYLLNKIQRHEDVELYGGGDFYRDYIHVEDLCRAIMCVLSKGKVNEIFNIGNRDPQLFKNIIGYAKKTFKSKSNIGGMVQPDFHKLVQVESMFMDNSKLTNLGYSPTISVYDYIDSMVNNGN